MCLPKEKRKQKIRVLLSSPNRCRFCGFAMILVPLISTPAPFIRIYCLLCSRTDLFAFTFFRDFCNRSHNNSWTGASSEKVERLQGNSDEFAERFQGFGSISVSIWFEAIRDKFCSNISPDLAGLSHCPDWKIFTSPISLNQLSRKSETRSLLSISLKLFQTKNFKFFNAFINYFSFKLWYNKHETF